MCKGVDCFSGPDMFNLSQDAVKDKSDSPEKR